MANYTAVCRTNYFRVTDEKKFERLLSCLSGTEDRIYNFTKIMDGAVYHALGTYGPITYQDSLDKDEYAEDDFDYFLYQIQKILPDNEALIYMESGYEKLRYVTGVCIVVTKNDIRSVNLQDEAIKMARNMLKDDSFTTSTSY